MKIIRLIPIWVACLALAACAADPIDKPGTWQPPPKGLTSNDQNLRAMVVNPRDLTYGRGETSSPAITAASAARRELTGRRAPLPAANVVLPEGGGGQNQPAPAPGAGAAPRTE